MPFTLFREEALFTQRVNLSTCSVVSILTDLWTYKGLCAGRARVACNHWKKSAVSVFNSCSSVAVMLVLTLFINGIKHTKHWESWKTLQTQESVSHRSPMIQCAFSVIGQWRLQNNLIQYNSTTDQIFRNEHSYCRAFALDYVKLPMCS